MKRINFGRRRVVSRSRVMSGVKEIHPPKPVWVISNA